MPPRGLFKSYLNAAHAAHAQVTHLLCGGETAHMN